MLEKPLSSIMGSRVNRLTHNLLAGWVDQVPFQLNSDLTYKLSSRIGDKIDFLDKMRNIEEA